VRIRVEVERNGNAWEIRYPNLRAKADPPVTVELVSAGPITLPKTAGFDPGVDSNRELALSVTTLKTPQPGDVARFGDYLFDLLLGAVWADIQAAEMQSPPDALETVEISSADQEFHRLPWEMARSPEGYLAKLEWASFAWYPREVRRAGEDCAPRALCSGLGYQRQTGQGGRGVSGLMKRLEATSLVMETQVLLRATARASKRRYCG
jgi:hypothetical protein